MWKRIMPVLIILALLGGISAYYLDNNSINSQNDLLNTENNLTTQNDNGNLLIEQDKLSNLITDTISNQSAKKYQDIENNITTNTKLSENISKSDVYVYDYTKDIDSLISIEDYDKTIIAHDKTGNLKYNITAREALEIIQKQYSGDWTHVMISPVYATPEFLVGDSLNETWIEVSPNGEIWGGHSSHEVPVDSEDDSIDTQNITDSNSDDNISINDTGVA
ncbi:hypothetical protein [Methanosphaera sp. WGK6]|uniref:hypothetical protein n=1 Tax=Methanosphaera sp. WGK6 TaxID=1561964 RepID=UPI00084C52E9|nr:hypothetical protein [Methanosphaera sp. WGK6]OED30915.1 hypothetical protein NL43_00995 [Methanosphaera sp. WGK6]